jgi:hypothetical protein
VSKNNGGQAFPMPSGWNGLAHHEEHHGNDEECGMSLRDYFAGQVLQGVFVTEAHVRVAAEIDAEAAREGVSVSATDVGHLSETRIASMCYAMADAMLAERSKS